MKGKGFCAISRQQELISKDFVQGYLSLSPMFRLRMRMLVSVRLLLGTGKRRISASVAAAAAAAALSCLVLALSKPDERAKTR